MIKFTDLAEKKTEHRSTGIFKIVCSNHIKG